MHLPWLMAGVAFPEQCHHFLLRQQAVLWMHLTAEDTSQGWPLV